MSTREPDPPSEFKKLNDYDLMPFGKHEGTPMQDVPANYLHWLWTNGCQPGTASSPRNALVADYIERNLSALQDEYPNGIWD